MTDQCTQTRPLFLPDVVARTGLAYAEVRAAVRMGTFPAPTPLTVGSSWGVWSSTDVDQWTASRSQ